MPMGNEQAYQAMYEMGKDLISKGEELVAMAEQGGYSPGEEMMEESPAMPMSKGSGLADGKKAALIIKLQKKMGK